MRNDAMRSIAYGKSLIIKTAQFTFGVTKLYFVSIYNVNRAVWLLFSLLRSLFRRLGLNSELISKPDSSRAYGFFFAVVAADEKPAFFVDAVTVSGEHILALRYSYSSADNV